VEDPLDPHTHLPFTRPHCAAPNARDLLISRIKEARANKMRRDYERARTQARAVNDSRIKTNDEVQDSLTSNASEQASV
jgi:chromatin segregation and condensation protein Rec8/ScpA/Scc1 (kleisin family)